MLRDHLDFLFYDLSVYNLSPSLRMVFFLSVYRYSLYIKEIYLLSAIQVANIFLFLYYYHAIFDHFFPSCIYLTVLNQTVNSFHRTVLFPDLLTSYTSKI